MIESKISLQNEKAVLVGLVHKDQGEDQVKEYLTELAFLADTAGAQTQKNVYPEIAAPR